MRARYFQIIFSYCLSWFLVFAYLSFYTPAFSNEIIPEGALLVDEEAGSIVQEWLDSLAKAAGLKGLKIHPFFIASSQVNAGATLGNRIVIFTGLIFKCQNAEQFLAVLAHEVGHIQGGHIARLDSVSQQAMQPSMAAMILGAAAALATGNAGPLMAGLSGGSEIYMRKMMHHSRTNEISSDQAAARFCRTLGWEPAIQGLYDFLQMLRGDSFMPKMDPYLMTHPPEEVRMAALKSHLTETPRALPVGIQEKFQRLKAKFAAYLLTPNEVLRAYPETTLIGKYARVIVAHRQGQRQESLSLLEGLLKDHPQDPYFWELKGQTLMELGEATSAIEAYRQALKFKPQSAIFKLQLGQLLADHGNEQELKEAAKMLRPLADHPQEALPLWRVLSRVYGKTNEMSLASWALAEEAYQAGDFKAAKGMALRAQKLGLKDKRAIGRVQDILSQKEVVESSLIKLVG